LKVLAENFKRAQFYYQVYLPAVEEAAEEWREQVDVVLGGGTAGDASVTLPTIPPPPTEGLTLQPLYSDDFKVIWITIGGVPDAGSFENPEFDAGDSGRELPQPPDPVAFSPPSISGDLNQCLYHCYIGP
jgi:hypothetical protein